MAIQQHYVLGSSAAERGRTGMPGARLHEPEARWLLDQTGIGPAWQAIDVGCGPIGVLDLLAERVGPEGKVVGLDGEPRMLAAAGNFIAERGLTNVDLIRADAAVTGLPPARSVSPTRGWS
jgi:ubiquinone/menaquinone biosynthesis C-methylase UbiE